MAAIDRIQPEMFANTLHNMANSWASLDPETRITQAAATGAATRDQYNFFEPNWLMQCSAELIGRWHSGVSSNPDAPLLAQLYPNTEEGVVALQNHLYELQTDPLVAQRVAELVDAIYGPEGATFYDQYGPQEGIEYVPQDGYDQQQLEQQQYEQQLLEQQQYEQQQYEQQQYEQ